MRWSVVVTTWNEIGLELECLAEGRDASRTVLEETRMGKRKRSLKWPAANCHGSVSYHTCVVYDEACSQSGANFSRAYKAFESALRSRTHVRNHGFVRRKTSKYWRDEITKKSKLNTKKTSSYSSFNWHAFLCCSCSGAGRKGLTNCVQRRTKIDSHTYEVAT